MEYTKDLFYLTELDSYKVDGRDFDVRGWLVKDAAGQVIGPVEDLMIDKISKRVIYLDIAANHEYLNNSRQFMSPSPVDKLHKFHNVKGDEHLFIPVDLVRLDPDKQLVTWNPGLPVNTREKPVTYNS